MHPLKLQIWPMWPSVCPEFDRPELETIIEWLASISVVFQSFPPLLFLIVDINMNSESGKTLIYFKIIFLKLEETLEVFSKFHEKQKNKILVWQHNHKNLFLHPALFLLTRIFVNWINHVFEIVAELLEEVVISAMLSLDEGKIIFLSNTLIYLPSSKLYCQGLCVEFQVKNSNIEYIL